MGLLGTWSSKTDVEKKDNVLNKKLNIKQKKEMERKKKYTRFKVTQK